MSSDEAPAQEYRGIKRSHQACLTCRRKKAKCSGERPVCEHCRRLSQDCQWDCNRAKSIAEDRTGSNTDNNRWNNDLLARVGAIENKLDRFTAMLNDCLPGRSSFPNMNWTSPQSPHNTCIRTPASGLSSPKNTATTIVTKTPRFKGLPPLPILGSLIDVYFSHVHNQPYSFFHEHRFRQRLANGLLPDYLQFAIIASALRFSDHPYYTSTYQEAATSYASESWKRIVLFWLAPEADPHIHVCQAITLLAIVDFTAGRRYPGWLKIGLSIRIAQDLGLMNEPDSSLSNVDQEEGRRVFWSLYIIDRLISCGRGRSESIADNGCRLQLPCDEESFRNGACRKTPTFKELFSVVDSTRDRPCYLALGVFTAYIFGRCAKHSVYEYTKGESQLPPWDSKSEFAAIYSVLLQFENQYELGSGVGEVLRRDCLQYGKIDMQLAGPVIFSHAVFRTSQCLLHHPYLLYQQCKVRGFKAPQSFLNRALQTCRENACAMSELLQQIREAGYIAFMSFIGYCTTVAGSVHTMYLHHADSSIRQQALECLQINTLFLEEYSRYWKSGPKMIAILQNLAAQSASLSLLLNSCPQLDNLELSLLENLWAAVDYTTMTQFSGPITAPDSFRHAAAGCYPSFAYDGSEHWNHEPNPEPNPEPDFLVQPSASNGNLPSSYDTVAFEGMSPIAAFFGSGTAIGNFGG